jgi:trehalose 6-phosphate phosphatase
VRESLLTLVCRYPDLILENKGMSLALHFRRAPELAGLARDHASRIVAELGAPFVLLEGDMLYEIKPAKPDKATAIESFLGEPPFAGRKPIFVGDDMTDRDAFAIVKQHGGMTIAVGERIAGDRQLANPRAVRRWLGSLLTTGDPTR